MKKIKIELVIYQVEVVWPLNSRLKTRMTVLDYILQEEFCFYGVQDNP